MYGAFRLVVGIAQRQSLRPRSSGELENSVNGSLDVRNLPNGDAFL
jgi:hypothetical protein